jgi:hypothetical protein
MEEAEEFQTEIFIELYLIAFNYLYFPLSFSFVIFLFVILQWLRGRGPGKCDGGQNHYCDIGPFNFNSYPPQEIKEMKINPSRNEPSPGLAIAPMVWSQHHNILLNSSPPP